MFLLRGLVQAVRNISARCYDSAHAKVLADLYAADGPSWHADVVRFPCLSQKWPWPILESGATSLLRVSGGGLTTPSPPFVTVARFIFCGRTRLSCAWPLGDSLTDHYSTDFSLGNSHDTLIRARRLYTRVQRLHCPGICPLAVWNRIPIVFPIYLGPALGNRFSCPIFPLPAQIYIPGAPTCSGNGHAARP